MLRLSTSSVIAIAKTPSLKAMIRENSSPQSSRDRLPRCSGARPSIAGIIDPGRDGTPTLLRMGVLAGLHVQQLLRRRVVNLQRHVADAEALLQHRFELAAALMA